MASSPRSFDPAVAARFLLIAAAWMAGLGLVNIYFLTASTLENVFFFGCAGFALVQAVLVKVVLPRLLERSPTGNAEP